MPGDAETNLNHPSWLLNANWKQQSFKTWHELRDPTKKHNTRHPNRHNKTIRGRQHTRTTNKQRTQGQYNRGAAKHRKKYRGNPYGRSGPRERIYPELNFITKHRRLRGPRQNLWLTSKNQRGGSVMDESTGTKQSVRSININTTKLYYIYILYSSYGETFYVATLCLYVVTTPTGDDTLYIVWLTDRLYNKSHSANWYCVLQNKCESTSMQSCLIWLEEKFQDFFLIFLVPR